MKKLNKSLATTRLERHVLRWINEQADNYDDGAKGILDDLMRGGCQSGFVSHLIYYTDTVKFFHKHRQEISSLLKEAIESTGCQPADLFGEKWDREDPLAQEDLNRNLLAWFAFEETARNLAEKAGIEL